MKINAPCLNRPIGKVTYNQRIRAMSEHGDNLSAQQIAALTSCTLPLNDDLVFPMENIPEDVHLLLIAGDDDGHVPPEHAHALVRRLKLAGKHNYKLIMVRGFGHMYTEPYTPMVRGRVVRDGYTMNYGGRKYAHEAANEQVWMELINFLEQCKLRFNLDRSSRY